MIIKKKYQTFLFQLYFYSGTSGGGSLTNAVLTNTAIICSISGREILNDFTVFKEDNQKRYRCNQCGKPSVSLASIKNHMLYLHLQEDQPSICDICNKEFKSKFKLKRHMFVHKLHDCPECSRKFSKAEMWVHRSEKHGVKIPTCGVCGYRSERSDQVVEHQRRVHLQEKNVACPECDMKFYNEAYLKMHMVRHTAAKEFECKFCNKMFRRLHDLKRHVKIHTGDKRKVCHVCGERFVQKASLTHHMVKHHPDSV